MSDLTTGLDGFAMAITSIVEPLPELCQEKVNKATVQATRKGAKTVQSYASKGGVHEWSGEYVTGFKSHITGGVPARFRIWPPHSTKSRTTSSRRSRTRWGRR